MQEKRKDLKVTQQKKVLAKVLNTLNESHPSFYYLSTIEIAGEIKRYISDPGNLNQDELSAIKGLSQRDIQILLSLHND